MTDNIVDLYKKSETIDIGVSQKIVTKEATVEFYGVNKIKKGHKLNPPIIILSDILICGLDRNSLIVIFLRPVTLSITS